MSEKKRLERNLEKTNPKQRIKEHISNALGLLNKAMEGGADVKTHIEVTRHCYQAYSEFALNTGDLNPNERDSLYMEITALSRAYGVMKDYQRIHLLGSIARR